MLAFDSVDGCGKAEDAHEEVGGFLVACRDGAPFLEPRPEAFDLVAVVVDPVWACDWINALRRSSFCLGGIAGHVPS